MNFGSFGQFGYPRGTEIFSVISVPQNLELNKEQIFFGSGSFSFGSGSFGSVSAWGASRRTEEKARDWVAVAAH